MKKLSKRTSSDSPVRNTFTLIELLVVIAIIAILAAMLMPALQQARNTAKGSNCLSNLNQLSKATMFYQDAFEDFFPWGAYDVSISYFWNGWLKSSTSANRFKSPLRDFWPTEKIDDGTGGMGASRFGSFEKIGRGVTVSKYACPATTATNMNFEIYDTVKPNYPVVVNSVFISYAVNTNLINNWETKPVRMTTVKRPARLLTYGDSCGSGQTKYYTRLHPDVDAKYNKQSLSARHNQAANIAYADGHVKPVNYNDIPAFKYSSARFPYEGPDLNPFAK